MQPAIFSPTTLIELCRFIVSMKFSSKTSDKLPVNLKPLYDSLQDNVEFHWNNESEKVFQQIKTSTKKVLPSRYLIPIIHSLVL